MLLLAAAALVLPPGPAHAATVRVDMVDNAFKPVTATVSVGDVVSWRNVGEAPHEVTASAFGSGNVDPGKGWTWTAAKTGTFRYVCKYHESAGMKGTLVVRAAAAATPGHPKTGGDRVRLGLLMLVVAAVAGGSLRQAWRVR